MRSSVAVAFLYIFFGPFGVFCLVGAFIFVGRAQYMETVVALVLLSSPWGWLRCWRRSSRGK
jgi:hypothetical protein